MPISILIAFLTISQNVRVILPSSKYESAMAHWGGWLCQDEAGYLLSSHQLSNTTPWNRRRTQTSYIYKKFTTTEEAADVSESGGKQKRLSHEARHLDLWPSVHRLLSLGILVTDKGELEREVQVCLWMPIWGFSIWLFWFFLKKK